MDDEQWKALLEQVRQQGETLDSAQRRQSMTQLASSLGVGSGFREELPVSQAGLRAMTVKPGKLRCFSGARDPGSGVVDYSTWRLYAKSVVEDTLLSEGERKRIIVESLLPPALEIAASADSTVTSKEVLELLDRHYGEVADGYELYTQFRSCIQDVKDTACEYLQRLHLLALRTSSRGGMEASDIAKEVFRQFECSCADEDLLQRIDIRHLRQKTSPTPVDELLLSVRTEETRTKEKKRRLKARTARANMLKAQEDGMASEMASLQQTVEALTLQLQGHMATGSRSQPMQQPSSVPPAGQPQTSSQGFGRGFSQSRRSRGRGQGQGRGRGQQSGRGSRRPSGFCFLCGQDGHYQSVCTQPRNAELVQQRLLSTVQGAEGNSRQGNY